MFSHQRKYLMNEFIPQKLQVLQEHEKHEEQEIMFESLFNMKEDFHPELYSFTPPYLGEAELSCK